MELMLFCVPLTIITSLLLIFGILFNASFKKTSQERAGHQYTSHNPLLRERAISPTNIRINGNYRRYDLLLDTCSKTTGYQTGSNGFPHISFQIPFLRQHYAYPIFSDKCVYTLLFDSSVIPTGDVYLDQRLAIYGQPKALAMDLFSAEPLRSKLLQARRLNLEINGSRLVSQHGNEKYATCLN